MGTDPAGVTGERHELNEDEQLLHKLGYAQELYRAMGGFGNFAISFTIISILAGCLTSYFIAFNNGGPVAVTWGWLLVGSFCTIVALAMAEIASSMPTAGGLYYWASNLGSPGWGWFTGWFNLIGQISVTAAIDYGAATFISSLFNLWFDMSLTKEHVFIVYSAVILLHLGINLFGLPVLNMLNTISAWWHMAGVVVIVLILIAIPDHHQSTSFVFTHTINASGFSGANFSSIVFWFVFGIGLLMAQYTITGFDASAHLSEETKGAARGAALGMVMSVVVSVVFGFILLVAVTYAVQDVDGTVGAGAFDVQFIWTTATSTKWAEFMLVIACVAQLFCGAASVTSASRMLFAFSRDGAVPGHALLRRLALRPHTRLRRHGDLRAGLGAHVADAVECGRRLPRRHVDRRHRPLSGVRLPDHPALHEGRQLRGRIVDARQALPLDRSAGDRLGRADLHPLHDADGPGGDSGQGRVRLEFRQLRAAHGWRCVPPLRRLVGALGSPLVQGADPPG